MWLVTTRGFHSVVIRTFVPAPAIIAAFGADLAQE